LPNEDDVAMLLDLVFSSGLMASGEVFGEARPVTCAGAKWYLEVDGR
jgi:hypothetical protein